MIWSLVVFQELLLYFTVFASEEDSLSRSAYFITQENKHLAGHVVQRLKSSNLMSCNHICMTTSWCTSTNFKESTQCSEDDKGICELNIHEFVPFNENTKLIDQPGVTFSVFLKGCLKTGCLNGGSCSFNEEQETFTCSCKQQWIGDKCEVRMDCPPGWLRYGSACYYIDDTPTSKQADARTTCRNTGADLPVIRSAADDKFIFNLMKNQSTVTHLGLWLGMNRSAVGSKFYWVDGTPLEGQYQNWADGEPNNNNNGEHCGNMYGTPGDRNVKPGKWNDLPCEYGYFGNKSVPVILCQKPISKTV